MHLTPSTGGLALRLIKQLVCMKDTVSSGPEADRHSLKNVRPIGTDAPDRKDIKDMALRLKITFSKITNLIPISTGKSLFLSLFWRETWDELKHTTTKTFCGTVAEPAGHKASHVANGIIYPATNLLDNKFKNVSHYLTERIFCVDKIYKKSDLIRFTMFSC